MKNWGENVQWNPSETAFPQSEQEVVEWVLKAKKERKQIRAIGSGHSFSPVCATPSITLSLDNLQGIQNTNEANRVRTFGGTKLKKLGESLFELGLAQENLGDINVQSIAGAASTGTHGTGIGFGNICTQIEELSFVNGKGELHTVDASDPDLFNSARIALGGLGIITQYKLRCVPAFNLHLEKKAEKIDAVIEKLDDSICNNRNFEFFWFPHTDYAQTKYSNQVETSATRTAKWKSWVDEVLLENYVFNVLCHITRVFPSTTPALTRFSAFALGNETKVSESHKVFATPRLVKFTEMEYNVPIESFREVFSEIRLHFKKKKYPINFPIECRFVNEDDIFLSPSYGRKSAYLAVHAFKGVDNRAYFSDMEAIFREHQGRPHWGKMHSPDAGYFSKVYPKWEAFLEQRKFHDPEGIFLNEHLKKTFGL